LSKFCNIDSGFVTGDESNVVAFSGYEEGMILEAIPFCENPLICYKLVTPNTYVRLKNGNFCEIYNELYGQKLCKVLGLDPPPCMYGLASDHCSFEQIMPVNYVLLNEGSALLLPNKNLLYQNVQDEEWIVGGFKLKGGIHNLFRGQHSNLTYFYTQDQIDENFDETSVFSNFFNQLKNVELRQYLTWVVTFILGFLSIFSAVKWCIPMMTPKKSTEIEMTDMTKANRKRRTYRKVDQDEK
jgi:hypothetical protein